MHITGIYFDRFTVNCTLLMTKWTAEYMTIDAYPFLRKSRESVESAGVLKEPLFFWSATMSLEQPRNA